jgi:hypothetical protein
MICRLRIRKPALRNESCLSAERSSYSKEVRLGRFLCSRGAISTDLNCSEPNLVPVSPDVIGTATVKRLARLISFSGFGASPEMPLAEGSRRANRLRSQPIGTAENKSC